MIASCFPPKSLWNEKVIVRCHNRQVWRFVIGPLVCCDAAKSVSEITGESLRKGAFIVDTESCDFHTHAVVDEQMSAKKVRLWENG